MSRRTYAAALNDVLAPMGFERGERSWSRTVGTVLEEIDLQKSQIAGTTANLWSKDLATEELLRQAIPWKRPLDLLPSVYRIGTLMNGSDRWWKNDPNGPAELAEAIRVHAPAFFEGRRSLEDQARLFGRAEPRWKPSGTASRMYLALTLYRMGQKEEACAVLQSPPRTAPASWLAQAESVRNWLGCRSKPD
ncbi:DUF4304 domain-containing protein [Phenylobacterium sp.]|uniref:DUF4304 domain-containing protein n=1 Tax=Phenylobacterium sp. TaxID=1871053 RepID=UPI00120C4D50|nr:DUF4304 domain-containing protein [Phenylobacterium sp.]THD63925.1 MAG: hypothetical protein E8A49_04435 [Phenylobacterium sp.]